MGSPQKKGFSILISNANKKFLTVAAFFLVIGVVLGLTLHSLFVNISGGKGMAQADSEVQLVEESTTPEVVINSPVANSDFTAPAAISIAVSINNDSEGNVSKVKFYEGNNNLGEDNNGGDGWTFDWQGVGEGTYTIKAKAFDSGDSELASAEVTGIKVNPKPNERPVVQQIISPSAGYYTAPVSIQFVAKVIDPDNNLKEVRMWMDGQPELAGTLVATDTYQHDYVDLGEGNYTFKVKAIDHKGSVSYIKTVSIIVKSPPVQTNRAPNIVIDSPRSDQEFDAPASIDFKVTAVDPDGYVDRVEFYVNGNKLSEDTQPPYNFRWNGVPKGSYVLVARAFDDRGDGSVSGAAYIEVKEPASDNQSLYPSPVANIISPVDKQEFQAPANIQIASTVATSGTTPTKVEFYNGDEIIGESTEEPYIFEWMQVPVGEYTIKVKVYDDKDGSSFSSPIDIKVVSEEVDQSPTVRIVSPEPEEVFKAPATIEIITTTVDPDGGVDRVEFYDGDKKIGETKESPYNFTWKGVLVGEYTLIAKVFDSDGNETSSEPVKIKVNTSGESNKKNPVSRVEFYAGDTIIGQSNSIPFQFDWTGVTPGNYTLVAKGYDNEGNSTLSQFVSVTVEGEGLDLTQENEEEKTDSDVFDTNGSNNIPKITLTSPKNNEVFTSPANLKLSVNVFPIVAVEKPEFNEKFEEPANVDIVADVGDIDGSVKKVEFFHENDKIGESTESPYKFTWENLVEGTYSIKIKAFDDLGESSESEVVRFYVLSKSEEATQSQGEDTSFGSDLGLNANNVFILVFIGSLILFFIILAFLSRKRIINAVGNYRQKKRNPKEQDSSDYSKYQGAYNQKLKKEFMENESVDSGTADNEFNFNKPARSTRESPGASSIEDERSSKNINSDPYGRNGFSNDYPNYPDNFGGYKK
jgi:hypothetical protein